MAAGFIKLQKCCNFAFLTAVKNQRFLMTRRRFLYKPREDSFLLAEEIRKYISSLKDKNIKVLDLGTGSGIQAETCMQAGIPKQNIITSDINKDAIKNLKTKGFASIHSNLFSNIKRKFDLIIFNPPYLPESKYDKAKDTTDRKSVV